MKHLRLCKLLTVLAVLTTVFWARAAVGEDLPNVAAAVPAVSMKGAPELAIPPQGGELTLLMHRDRDTFVSFPRDIRKTHIPLSDPFYEAVHRYNLLRLRLSETKKIAAGSQGYILVETAAGDTIIHIRVAKHSEEAVGRLVLKLRSDMEPVRAQPPGRDSGADVGQESPKKRPGGLAADIEGVMTKSYAMGILAQVRERRKKREQSQAVAGRPGAATTSCAVQIDAGANEVKHLGLLFVAFGVINGCQSPYIMSEVALYDQYQSVNYAGTPRIWAPGAGEDEAQGATEGVGEILAEIGPGEEAIGLMLVNANVLAPGPLSVRVAGPHGLRPLVAATEKYEFVLSKPPFIRTMSLHVQALGGGIWLANPQDKDELDPTTVKGLGVRLAYHLFELLSVEVDVVGASSGESRFEDAQSGGDLLRSAKLGRVSFGGALRLSSGPYIPVLRVGLGLQGASHNAELEVGGVRMPGPEVGFEWTEFLYFGGGVDIRLGEHFTAGVAASTVRAFGDDAFRRSIELGIHLGGSWKP